MSELETVIAREEKRRKSAEQEKQKREEERQQKEREAASVQREIVPEGKKAKLKRLVKRALGRTEVPQPVEEVPEILTACVGNSDQFQ